MELLKGRGLELKEFQPFATLASEVPELLSERGEVESEATLLEEVFSPQSSDEDGGTETLEAEAVLPGERVVSSGPSAQDRGARPVESEAAMPGEGVPSGPPAQDDGVLPAEAAAALLDEAILAGPPDEGEGEMPLESEAVLPDEVLSPQSSNGNEGALLEEAEAVLPEEEVVPPRSPDEDLEALLEAAEAAMPEEAAQEAPAGEAGEQPVSASSGRALSAQQDLNYVGEVQLAMVPPVDLTKMSELYERLQKIPEVKILRTVGSWDRGSTITVTLDKPLPLIDMLSELPGFDARPALPLSEGRLKEALGPLGSRGREARRIEIETDIVSGGVAGGEVENGDG